jgi:hypothetical protein
MEKTNVMGFIKRKIVPIHHMPQLPTLMAIKDIPIVMHMGMMPIIV